MHNDFTVCELVYYCSVTAVSVLGITPKVSHSVFSCVTHELSNLLMQLSKDISFHKALKYNILQQQIPNPSKLCRH